MINPSDPTVAVGGHPLLAREGWPFIALTAMVTIISWAVGWGVFALVALILLVFCLQFFRDPPRQPPGDEKTLVSPCDGRVIAVGQGTDPWLDRDCIKVSIFMNVFNVHSNRLPLAGEVLEQWYRPGKFVNASLDKASTENERNALWMKTADGHHLVVVQVAGLVARRILCYLKPGEHGDRGARYGFIRFGSRIDLFLPLECDITVGLGDKLSAGVDVIGKLSDYGEPVEAQKRAQG
ncbi:phosphatidylserine decarboxylase [Gammaproteobacteria bacterium]|nr:phosphatidylserine decarboxylase [Gammaproteobacteria bacterium]